MSDETPRPRRSDRHRRSHAPSHSPREIRGLVPGAAVRQGTSSLRPRKRSAALDPAARRRRRGRIAIIVGVVLLAMVVAGVAWAVVFVHGIDVKIHPVQITDPALAAALQKDAPAPGAPFYILLMGEDLRPGLPNARSDTLMVARIDPQKKTVMLVSVMRDSRVDIPGHGMNKINAAFSFGGAQLALETVRELTGLPITDYITVDFTGFRAIVDAMGGVWVDVPEKVDGIPSGTARTPWELKNRVIQKGYQKLNGVQALTWVRARDQFADQDYTRVKDQQIFLKALAKQALQLSNVFNATKIINAVADDITTNMSLTDLADLALEMRGMKSTDIQSATLPSTPTYINGVSYVQIDQAGMDAMLSRMQAGGPLVPGSTSTTTTAGSTSASSPAPSGITITIRNGAGVSGLAKEAATYFKAHGFKIESTGNASQFVYGQTFVVYKTATQADAGVVANALGFGKVIPAAGMYSFKGDVLVVIGKDWKNPNSSQTP